MLLKTINAELSKSFPNLNIEFCEGSNPIAVIQPVHPSWQPIEIWQEGDEITIHFGQYTHAHYGYYDDEISAEHTAQAISKEVISALTEVFSDELEFYHAMGGGGARKRGSQSKLSQMVFGVNGHLWSGALSK